MNRSCIEITEILIKSLSLDWDKTVRIYIDKENLNEMLERFKKKTRRIVYEMLSNSYNFDLYRTEYVSKKAFNITAMKLITKGQSYRIYCKEYFDEKLKIKRIVLIEIYQKKEFDKKLKNFIEKLGRYDYEFE